MQYKNLLLVICILFSVSFTVNAKSKQQTKLVELVLVRIEAKKVTENDGDELYFTVTSYPAQGLPQLYRIPIYPSYWLPKDLANLKDVPLWRGEIPADASTLLIISFLEHDLPDLLPDDHLGSVQVKITNNKKELGTIWGQPNFADQPKIEQIGTKPAEFMLFGDGGKYLVEFKVNVLKQGR